MIGFSIHRNQYCNSMGSRCLFFHLMTYWPVQCICVHDPVMVPSNVAVNVMVFVVVVVVALCPDSVMKMIAVECVCPLT